MKTRALRFVAFLALVSIPSLSQAVLVTYTGSNGLQAQADYSFSGSVLTIALQNTSVSPFGGGGGNMVLSSINIDLGTGFSITGGSAALGAGSNVVARSGSGWAIQSTPDLNAQWGYSNTGVGNSPSPVPNALNVSTSHTNGGTAVTAFNGDPGPLAGGLDYGLVAAGSSGFGNRHFILDTVILTLNLNQALVDLSFLNNGSYVEFGSDFAYVPNDQLGDDDDTTGDDDDQEPVIPEPASLALLGLGLGLAGMLKRPRRTIG